METPMICRTVAGMFYLGILYWQPADENYLSAIPPSILLTDSQDPVIPIIYRFILPAPLLRRWKQGLIMSYRRLYKTYQAGLPWFCFKKPEALKHIMGTKSLTSYSVPFEVSLGQDLPTPSCRGKKLFATGYASPEYLLHNS